MARDTITQPSLYRQENQGRRVIRRVSDDMQQDKKRAADLRAMDDQRRELALSGVPTNRLPVINTRMSPADMATAQSRLNQSGGASLAQSRDPNYARPAFTGFAPTSPGVGRRTGLALPAPAGGPLAGIPAPGAPEMRGSTPAEIRRFETGAVPSNDIRAVAGTGQEVATPYGPISSRAVAAGTPQAPATVTDTGVTRPAAEDWQQQIVRRFPQVGVAGTPENKAFVEAYKAQNKPGAENSFNPVSLAEGLFKDPKANLAKVEDMVGTVKSRAHTEESTGLPAGVTASAQARNDINSGGEPAPVPSPASLAAAGAKSAIGDAYERIQQKWYSPRSAANGIANVGRIGMDIFNGFVNPGAPSVSGGSPAFPDNPAALTPDVPAAPAAGGRAASAAMNPVNARAPARASTTLPVSGTPPPPLPGMPDYTGPSVPLSMTSPGQFGGFNEGDLEAFSANPADDEFRKKLREPDQTYYS